MLLMTTIVALAGGTADMIVPGATRRAGTAGAGYAGTDAQHRPPTPAATCRPRSQSPWNIPISIS
jgi:hypothetical protein